MASRRGAAEPLIDLTLASLSQLLPAAVERSHGQEHNDCNLFFFWIMMNITYALCLRIVHGGKTVRVCFKVVHTSGPISKEGRDTAIDTAIDRIRRHVTCT